MAEKPHFISFADVAAYLDQLGQFRMRPGPERISAVLRALKLLNPPYCVVQVAGTNGKGSVSAMLASLAQAHGYRTGVHLSPAFVSVREGVRVNGAALPEAVWVERANEIMAHGGEALSHFELLVALAVSAFAHEGVEVAVMESGLGGSFDATTALDADLAVFTPIGMDHQHILGNSLSAIAANKAGAIRPDRAAISAPQQPEALEELRAAAHAVNARLHVVPGENTPVESPFDTETEPALPGEHQQANARLALAAWRHLRDMLAQCDGERPDADAPDPVSGLERRALSRAWLPGRLQYIPPAAARAVKEANEGGLFPGPLGRPPLLLDGAHNSHAMAALGHALARQGIAPGAVIFSCLADKDLPVLLPLLRALATGPIFVPPIKGNPRACDQGELAERIGLDAMPVDSLELALQAATGHLTDYLPEAFEQPLARNPVLLCGSLYLLGEFYALLPRYLER